MYCASASPPLYLSRDTFFFSFFSLLFPLFLFISHREMKKTKFRYSAFGVRKKIACFRVCTHISMPLPFFSCTDFCACYALLSFFFFLFKKAFLLLLLCSLLSSNFSFPLPPHLPCTLIPLFAAIDNLCTTLVILFFSTCLINQ